MSTVNASTGFSPFQLHLGHQPRMLPPLVDNAAPCAYESEEESTTKLLSQLEHDLLEVQDNLLAAKAAQATQVNKCRAPTIIFNTGDRVLLATKHRR
ncbi:hypothetical protein BDR05DRAFT_887105 [Suillus weaverae]|nr:hypothetical protein BDR05DRAFT_887105 [Suillus weaverae]